MLYLISFLGAVIAAVIASGKGRSVIGFAALGLFLPLIGVIIALCVGPLHAKQPNGEPAM